jgi:hypothetical protein
MLESISVIKETGNIRTGLSFATLTFPCFNEFYDLFYLNGVKVVPSNIDELLTPLGLAYWIMCDGSFTGSGVRLNTQSFTLSELELLQLLLHLHGYLDLWMGTVTFLVNLSKLVS